MKNLFCFPKALVAKLGWQLITLDSLWTEVVTRKYISSLSIGEWILLLAWSSSISLSIWRENLNSFGYIRVG